MLLALGIIVSLFAFTVFVLIGAAQMMSTTGRADWREQWPAFLLAFFAALIFVARHFLHGHQVTW